MFRKVTTNTDKVIFNEIKKKKHIIYGAQSIKKQVGAWGSRPTQDWDLFNKQPRQSANCMQKKLDRASGGNYFYSTPSKFHEGTHKVYYKGPDNVRGTRDDRGLVDLTQTPRGIRTIVINGVRYTQLSETVKDKRKALRDKQFAFRHEKDKKDLRIIQAHNKMKRRLW